MPGIKDDKLEYMIKIILFTDTIIFDSSLPVIA